VRVDSETTPVDTVNVIAQKGGTGSNRVVVVGAHLDSVPEGPGINDNGSGTATILTIAEEIARLGIEPRNTLRFAFWGAEEGGLFGSNHYVASLSDLEFSRLFVNLNFDMVASPNYVRFVYDGDGTLGAPGPDGSDVIEEVFTDFFDRRGLASEPTLFDGRSDYFAFIQNGIPAGGLFTGAEGIKTAEQAATYGGQAGRPYDPCYHQRCDNFRNINYKGLNEMAKAAAHAVLTFAQTDEPVPAPSAARVAAAKAAAEKLDYRGPRLVR
jgi:Zn-dependent M28 family amino/carboxypeptidase